MLDTVSVYNQVLHSRNTDKYHNSLLMYRYMMKNARQRREPVGYLDPHVVSEQTIKANAIFVENYVIDFFLARRNKEYILLPYNRVSMEEMCLPVD